MTGTRRKAGRLGPQVEGYRAWLAQHGYTPGTIVNMLKDLGRVGQWLSAEGLEAEHLNEERMVAFLSAWRAAGGRRVPGPRAMVPLLSYLREAGFVPEAATLVTPLSTLLAEYRSWLVQLPAAAGAPGSAASRPAPTPPGRRAASTAGCARLRNSSAQCSRAMPHRPRSGSSACHNAVDGSLPSHAPAEAAPSILDQPSLTAHICQ